MCKNDKTETVCYVKPDAGKVVPRLRRIFVDLFTGQAPNVQSLQAPRAGEFLRVEVGSGELYPKTVALCVLFDGVTTPYKRGKRKTLFLRNLRIRGKGSGFDHFLLCAACGAVQRLTAAELDELRPERCGQCRASLSTVACPVHHSFGHCSECSQVEVDACPFEAPDASSVADPAMQPV